MKVMDERMGRRGANRAQFILAGLLVLILYIYLAKKDTPDLSLLLPIEGVVKFFLRLPVPESARLFYLDLFIFLVVSFLLWAAFFAQFALPLRNFVQRLLASLYIWLFIFRRHGPAVLIENGEMPQDYPKEPPDRPGVMVLDTASAAVLRSRTAFTRSVGPGLVFTWPDEYLAATVDLHHTAWPNPPFGPPPEGEDIFAPWDEKKEPRHAYDERQKQRFETSGETRNGVEVVPTIFAVCCLDPDIKAYADTAETPPRNWRQRFRRRLTPYMQSQTQPGFRYNPEAVRRAVTAEAVHPDFKNPERQKRHLPWYQLPAYLAVDLWREYLRRFTFEQLFSEMEEHGGKTAYQVIVEKVHERLTQPFVAELDDFGRPTGRQIESREFQLLQERGIKVLAAPIRYLRFEKKVEQQIEDKWFSYWKWRAELEREDIKRQQSYRRHQAEVEALLEFAYQAARPFEPDFLGTPRPPAGERVALRQQMNQALENLVRGTLDLCITNTQLHPRAENEEKQLIEIIEWIRKQM